MEVPLVGLGDTIPAAPQLGRQHVVARGQQVGDVVGLVEHALVVSRPAGGQGAGSDRPAVQAERRPAACGRVEPRADDRPVHGEGPAQQGRGVDQGRDDVLARHAGRDHQALAADVAAGEGIVATLEGAGESRAVRRLRDRRRGSWRPRPPGPGSRRSPPLGRVVQRPDRRAVQGERAAPFSWPRSSADGEGRPAGRASTARARPATASSLTPGLEPPGYCRTCSIRDGAPSTSPTRST